MSTPAPAPPPPARGIHVTRLPIRLGQFLKHAGIVENGLEAKNRIRNGDITVNGEVESRRGRQLHDGDRVGTGTALYLVQYAAGSHEPSGEASSGAGEIE